VVVDDMPGRGGKSERGRQKQRERQSTTMQADGQDHSLYRLQSSQLLQVSQLKKKSPSTQPAFSLPLTLPTILFPLDPSSKWLTRTKTENPQYHTHAHTHTQSNDGAYDMVQYGMAQDGYKYGKSDFFYRCCKNDGKSTKYLFPILIAIELGWEKRNGGVSMALWLSPTREIK